MKTDYNNIQNCEKKRACQLMKKLLSVLLPAWILLTGILLIPVRAEDVSGYAEEIIIHQSGGDSAQNWINGALTENAGISSEWYILALSQSGDYDFSSYRNALHEYLETHEIYSASSRLKYALALASCGERDGYITEALENSIGQQGVMSWIYGLHLLNNGFTCESCSLESAVNQLLSMQLEDGGWAVIGTVGDIDVTAMAVQALAVHYGTNPEVQSACDRALEFLSEHQQDYGGYQSFGTENLESTAQVVTALSALGIDGFSDERFIRNGNTLLTGMLTFSNVTARIFSSILNYTLNQKLVFHSESSTVKSAVRYFLLAGVILLCNTLLLKGFVYLGISAWAAKIFTESLLFVCSYLVQQQFVFRRGHTV